MIHILWSVTVAVTVIPNGDAYSDRFGHSGESAHMLIHVYGSIQTQYTHTRARNKHA